jgi:hypothetical protein
MSLVIDEEMTNAFKKEGFKDDTSRAFGHFFAYAQGRCDLENYLREKFEEIGLLDPDGETIHMEDVESNLEWVLLGSVFEGKLIRKWDNKKECFTYQNSELGNMEAIKLIKELSKKKATSLNKGNEK